MKEIIFIFLTKTKSTCNTNNHQSEKNLESIAGLKVYSSNLFKQTNPSLSTVNIIDKTRNDTLNLHEDN